MVSPRDFDLGETHVPVHIWQGTQDTFGARPAMVDYVHGAIPGRRMTMHPDGHLSIMSGHVDEIRRGRS
jgi:hypothetical protein